MDIMFGPYAQIYTAIKLFKSVDIDNYHSICDIITECNIDRPHVERFLFQKEVSQSLSPLTFKKFFIIRV